MFVNDFGVLAGMFFWRWCLQLCAGGAEFVSGAKLSSFAKLYAYAAGGSFLVLARKEPKVRFWAYSQRGGGGRCLQPCAGGAEFVIGAKLGSFAKLYACAAGGSFLVLARKEPKKPLLGLGICGAAIVRVRTSEP
ncbi:MAG: hypothetical protein LBO63_04840 [Oscillospiraceae bacterium]|nr:hypothetical protein [Oscillospiraceae bacterium]